MRNALAVAALAVVLSACGPKRPPDTPPPGPPVPPPPTGTSTYAFVFDPGNPALNLEADTRFDRPSPRGQLALPLYPEDALQAREGRHREVVRIVIDDHGAVSDVGDSPLASSDGGMYAVSFRKAVDAAVRSWHFTPGVLRKVTAGNDLDGDGKSDYLITTSFDMVPVYYDVKFTFEIVDGKGVVLRE